MHVALRIFFIHFHPLPSTFNNFHPYSSNSWHHLRWLQSCLCLSLNDWEWFCSRLYVDLPWSVSYHYKLFLNAPTYKWDWIGWDWKSLNTSLLRPPCCCANNNNDNNNMSVTGGVQESSWQRLQLRQVWGNHCRGLPSPWRSSPPCCCHRPSPPSPLLTPFSEYDIQDA